MWDFPPPKLAMLAERLLSAFKDIEKAIQGEREAVIEAVRTANTKQSTPPLERAEIEVPESIEIHKSTAEARDDKRYQSRTLLVAWLTFAAIVLYAFISGWQWYEMRKTTKATQE